MLILLHEGELRSGRPATSTTVQEFFSLLFVLIDLPASSQEAACQWNNNWLMLLSLSERGCSPGLNLQNQQCNTSPALLGLMDLCGSQLLKQIAVLFPERPQLLVVEWSYFHICHHVVNTSWMLWKGNVIDLHIMLIDCTVSVNVLKERVYWTLNCFVDMILTPPGVKETQCFLTVAASYRWQCRSRLHSWGQRIQKVYYNMRTTVAVAVSQHVNVLLLLQLLQSKSRRLNCKMCRVCNINHSQLCLYSNSSRGLKSLLIAAVIDRSPTRLGIYFNPFRGRGPCSGELFTSCFLVHARGLMAELHISHHSETLLHHPVHWHSVASCFSCLKSNKNTL